MSRGLDGDDPFEDEEYRREVERERAERAREKAPPIVIHMPAHSSSPTAAQRFAMEREMACLQCGAGMLRGTQCRRCGAWCR